MIRTAHRLNSLGSVGAEERADVLHNLLAQRRERRHASELPWNAEGRAHPLIGRVSSHQTTGCAGRRDGDAPTDLKEALSEKKLAQEPDVLANNPREVMGLDITAGADVDT